MQHSSQYQLCGTKKFDVAFKLKRYFSYTEKIQKYTEQSISMKVFLQQKK